MDLGCVRDGRPEDLHRGGGNGGAEARGACSCCAEHFVLYGGLGKSRREQCTAGAGSLI